MFTRFKFNLVARYISILFSLFLLIPSQSVSAKDLRGRLAIGMESPFGLFALTQAPSALSLKYTFPVANKNVQMQIQGLAGASYSSEGHALAAGARFYYTIVTEDNCNIFLAGGGKFISLKANYESNTFLRTEGLFGVEFFLFGLENLAFSTSVGIQGDIGSLSRISTTPGALANLGVHYYF